MVGNGNIVVRDTVSSSINIVVSVRGNRVVISVRGMVSSSNRVRS